MPVFAAVKRSFGLLQKRDHRRLYGAMLSQVLISFLDTLGVLLIGLITFLASSTAKDAKLPGLLQSVLDFAGIGDWPTNKVLALLGMTAVLLFILRSIFAPLLLRRILRFLTGRSAAISGELTHIFFNQSLKEVQWETSQRLAFALGSGVTAAVSDTLGASVVIVAETSLLIMLATVLLVLAPSITLFTILYFALVMFFIQGILGRWSVRASKQKFAAEIGGQSTIQELVGSYREVFVGNQIQYYVDKFSIIRKSGASAQASLQLINYIPKYALEASLVVGASLLTGFEFLTKTPAAALSTLVLFMTAATRMFPSLLKIQGSATSIRAASSAAKYTDQLLEILKERNAFPYNSTALQEDAEMAKETHSKFVPNVSISNVNFKYSPEGESIINDISTEIEPGSFVAIVGPTGSGKSTLVDLLLGVSEPQSGSISISGVSPKRATKMWAGKISYVPQLVAMSDASVRENVALGVPKNLIDDEKIWQVLEQVRLASTLRESREGLDTEVGERGLRFSGGQRQRLGLARALYTDPSLLVLDEATSALDSETEQAVSQAIESLGDVTRITIAHRLATVMHADKVIYLDAGRIVASGTFDEVRNSVPEFDQQAKLLGL